MIKIDINLVFTIINLLVLYLLMKKFLFGPIINVMDQRKAMIDQQFAEAKERQDNAKALQEQYEGALKSAKEESYQIMEQARKEAKAQADHTVEETTAKVDAMLAKAQEDIRMERENAMRQMKGDVAELAMKAAAKVKKQVIRMTATAVNYAKTLYELSVSTEAVQTTKEIFREVPGLAESLENPLVPFEAKSRVIDRVIPDEMKNFIKVACRHRNIGLLNEIFENYEEICRRHKNILHAVMRYVTPPKDEQLKGIKAFLCREFQAESAEIEMIEDKSLIGGFVLQADGREFDWSMRGRYRMLQQKLTRR